MLYSRSTRKDQYATSIQRYAPQRGQAETTAGEIPCHARAERSRRYRALPSGARIVRRDVPTTCGVHTHSSARDGARARPVAAACRRPVPRVTYGHAWTRPRSALPNPSRQRGLGRCRCVDVRDSRARAVRAHAGAMALRQPHGFGRVAGLADARNAECSTWNNHDTRIAQRHDPTVSRSAVEPSHV